jgi:sugar/nucleoside kinase (ribokinase family)
MAADRCRSPGTLCLRVKGKNGEEKVAGAAAVGYLSDNQSDARSNRPLATSALSRIGRVPL